MKAGVLSIRNTAEVDELAGQVRASATKLQAWITSFEGDGIGLLRALKFEQIGFHPLDGHALNAIEQVNQMWTYLAALSAVRVLLELHPDAGGFNIAPGAHAAQPLDVMSEVEGLVGAETFAAVDPRNNRKLAKDLIKLADRAELHRYVFFASPLFPGTTRLPQLERDGVQVWSVDV
jgi:hypothetical protein